MPQVALKMTGIVKTYGGVPVLKSVDFEVEKGAIHALLGENGAGKTTLMNVLGGVTPMDAGSIELFGEKVAIDSPGDAQRLGIAFIHQELNVVNDLAVYENMFLGSEITLPGGRIDKKAMCEKTREVFERMNVEIDPRVKMSELETSYKQIVEIAKSLLKNARLIIMDEPTTSLTQTEIDNVFAIMKNLTHQQGATIIFISHKLGEVVDFCDSYTVLRNGELVANGAIGENGVKIDQTELARYMVGRDVLGVDVYVNHDISDVFFEARGISVKGHVSNVSFDVRKGEIVGFTGLLGDGKEQLVRSIFGDIPRQQGEIIMSGRKINVSHPAQGKKQGIGFLPSNRKENAIIKDFSVTGNITIVTLDDMIKNGALSRRLEKERAMDAREKLSIKADNLEALITSLSGGNQQKAVLSKWLYSSPELMILSNPTQGVDVGAKNEIYAQIMRLASQGMGIIITSAEAQEIVKICDRVFVMYHGEIRGELWRDKGEITEENIMILSTGGSLN
ncbi:MAG: sugar ABC transporter ATP-binding protein [Clostridia bacterium]|nr:sugar ABC transporter ATP-binding protein [Clostridia bacterium]